MTDGVLGCMQCAVDGRMLTAVTAVDDVDTGDFAEVVFEAVTGKEEAESVYLPQLAHLFILTLCAKSYSVHRSVPSDGGGHIFLNELSGELRLGRGGIDYEAGDRSFSLTVRAIDNPDGPVSDRLTVSVCA